ncbi:MAG: DUF211 domain-containing protein [Chloroflexota bacterium]|nr:DUF211 domain-containing protein [Chloroflexota bacterium]
MGNLRRLVLDVLKPLEPNIVELVQRIAALEGVDGVNISIYEIDHKVENAKITVEGTALSYENLKEEIKIHGGAIHSIDEVAAGDILIEDVITPQD